MLPRLLAVLRELEPNRHFLKLWTSQLLSLTAFNMVNFTLLLRVFELTHSATYVSLFVLSFGLPSLFFGAIAGVFADRWNRRTVLVVTSLLRTGIVLAYLPALNHLPTIYATTFVMATVTQFFAPAEGALIPELVERKRLVAANAVFMVTMFISFVIGYGIAGPLASVGGDTLPIFAAAGMFGLATLACASLPSSRGARHRVALRDAYRSVFAQLREGLQVVRQRAVVRYGLWQLTFIWAVIGVIMVVLPSFTGQALKLNLHEVSRLIILPIGIGMLFGGIVLYRAKRQFSTRLIISVSLFFAGLSIVGLGQISPLSDWLIANHLSFSSNHGTTQQWLTSILSTLLGLALAIVLIAAQTIIHEFTAMNLRGRVFGVLGMSVNAANTIPVLVAGALTDVLEVTTVVTFVGLAMVSWALLSNRIARLPGESSA